MSNKSNDCDQLWDASDDLFKDEDAIYEDYQYGCVVNSPFCYMGDEYDDLNDIAILMTDLYLLATTALLYRQARRSQEGLTVLDEYDSKVIELRGLFSRLLKGDAAD